MSATLRHAESDDFPADAYEEAAARIDGALDFVDEEARRLQDKVLQAGGLEPGRMRHSSLPRWVIRGATPPFGTTSSVSCAPVRLPPCRIPSSTP